MPGAWTFEAVALCLQVLVVPLLAGISGRGVKPLTWASCVIALVGVGLLEQGGAPPGIGDVWNLLSAVFFGLQVCPFAVAAPASLSEHFTHYTNALSVYPLFNVLNLAAL